MVLKVDTRFIDFDFFGQIVEAVVIAVEINFYEITIQSIRLVKDFFKIKGGIITKIGRIGVVGNKIPFFGWIVAK